MCVRHKTVIVTSVLKQPYSAVNIRTHADHIYTGDVSFINQEGCRSIARGFIMLKPTKIFGELRDI